MSLTLLPAAGPLFSYCVASSILNRRGLILSYRKLICQGWLLPIGGLPLLFSEEKQRRSEAQERGKGGRKLQLGCKIN